MKKKETVTEKLFKYSPSLAKNLEEEEEEVPAFPNTAICIGCGKEKHVNPFGFCEGCWIRFSHLRKKEVQTPCYDLN